MKKATQRFACLWLALIVLVCAPIGSAAAAAATEADITSTKIPPAATTESENEGSCSSSSSGAHNKKMVEEEGSCSRTPPAAASQAETKKATTSTTSPFQAVQSSIQRLLQSASTTVPSYYLMWSPGATKKLIISTLWLAVFHVYQDMLLPAFVVGNGNLQHYHLMGGCSLAMHNLVLPLLSSACCAIQLLLNLLGVGCAGFNSYLGPIRPYFVMLLAYLSLVVYPPTTFGGVVGVLVRGSMALLPEFVHVWNSYTASSSSSNKNNDGLFSQTTRMTLKDATVIHARVELIIPTMGCVACVNKINASLQQAERGRVFLEGTSWLVPPPDTGGRASFTLVASDQSELDALLQTVQDAIHGAGFDQTRVHSIQKQERKLSAVAGATSQNAANKNGNVGMIGRTDNSPKTQNTMAEVAALVTADIEYNIPSMSCEGCVSEINTAARQASPKVMDVSARLSEDYIGGSARISIAVRSNQELDLVLEEVKKSWEAAGFYDNELKSMELSSSFSTSITAVISWTVPTMSCGGCIRTIDSSVQEASPQHVVSVTSQLGEAPKSGGSTKVTLKVSSLKELDKVIASLEESIQSQGFDGIHLHSKDWGVSERPVAENSA